MVKLNDDVEQIVQNIQAPNIAVIGRTGVGKSTLINTVFGIASADVGAGSSITMGFGRYPKDEEQKTPIVLYDSSGYEAGKEESFVSNVCNFLEQQKEKGIEQQIHLIWYVVNAASARFELFDQQLIHGFHKLQVPVIIILSQCDRAAAYEVSSVKQEIKKLDSDSTYDIIETSANPLEVHGKPICEPYGLRALVRRTANLLPEIYSEAILVMQRADIKAKRRQAWAYIIAASTTCFSASIIPVPGSTPTAIVTLNATLCVQLAVLYGYGEFASFLGSISSLTISTLSALLLTTALDLISKLFTLNSASVIPAATAGVYIIVLGLAYSSVFERLVEEHITQTGKENVKKSLEKIFKEEFEKYLSLSKTTDMEGMKILFLREET